MLPTSFVKIRLYGLLAPANVNTELELARKLLRVADSNTTPPTDPKPADPRASILRPMRSPGS